MAKIAILGYGTVGSGVFEVLRINSDKIARNAGEVLEVKRILDLRDFLGDPAEKLITHDFEDILGDKEISVVAEVMGGVDPAYFFVKRLLECGKSVATSNKELVAKHGGELMDMAAKKGVFFLFEASVGGGIPIIRPMYSSLNSENICEITGILNGTTNYILSKMSEGMDFNEALLKAQELGYAERNPEADIKGFDPCRKIAILTSIASGKKVSFEDINAEGITGISSRDMQYAEKIGRVIKLLAMSKTDGGKIYAGVAPSLVGKTHPLSLVSYANNAIIVKGNTLGETMYYGPGAGKLPTGSAVVSDIIEAVSGSRPQKLWSDEKQAVFSLGELGSRVFIRVEYTDRQSAVSAVNQIFGISEIVEIQGFGNEFGFVTGEEKEKALQKKADELTKAGGIVGVINKLAVYS